MYDPNASKTRQPGTYSVKQVSVTDLATLKPLVFKGQTVKDKVCLKD